MAILLCLLVCTSATGGQYKTNTLIVGLTWGSKKGQVTIHLTWEKKKASQVGSGGRRSLRRQHNAKDKLRFFVYLCRLDSTVLACLVCPLCFVSVAMTRSRWRARCSQMAVWNNAGKSDAAKARKCSGVLSPMLGSVLVESLLSFGGCPAAPESLTDDEFAFAVPTRVNRSGALLPRLTAGIWSPFCELLLGWVLVLFCQTHF